MELSFVAGHVYNLDDNRFSYDVVIGNTPVGLGFLQKTFGKDFPTLFKTREEAEAHKAELLQNCKYMGDFVFLLYQRNIFRTEYTVVGVYNTLDAVIDYISKFTKEPEYRYVYNSEGQYIEYWGKFSGQDDKPYSCVMFQLEY